MDAEFWRGRRVLVTGHTGFKGSWLTLWLSRLGAKVAGFALAPPTSPSLFEQAAIGDLIKHQQADIRDLAALRQAFDWHRPQIVFHLAAQAIVRQSYVDPVETYATNLMGTVNVLEAIRHTPDIEAAVMITTDKVYDNKEWVWGYREDDRLGGVDPYSNSKACCELAIAAYRRSFFDEGKLMVASARAGNVIGGGDWARDRLIPDIVRAFIAGQQLVIRYPDAVRPWQHVLEPLHGYLMIAESIAKKQLRVDPTFNFGPDEADAQPVRSIVEHMRSRWADSAEWTLDNNANPHEAGQLRLDCSKARQVLNWKPALALPQALDWIVEWHKRNHHGESPRSLSEAQIDRYQDIVTP
uniref:CDP-glucose 4,6-dehydratase n=1 Tax=Rhodopseudomonas palustris (strain BisA53) TaxID=316055 RepID=Q07IQ5_RHOP5